MIAESNSVPRKFSSLNGTLQREILIRQFQITSKYRRTRIGALQRIFVEGSMEAFWVK